MITLMVIRIYILEQYEMAKSKNKDILFLLNKN